MSGQQETLDQALTAMQTQAANFAARFIPDAHVRAEYQRQIRAMSEHILSEVRAGRMTSAQGAELAHAQRNLTLDLMRGRSSDIGRAMAEQYKANGPTLERLIVNKARQMFGAAPEGLTAAQRAQVMEEIIVSAGRSNASFNRLAVLLRGAGRVFVFASVGIAIYQIAAAEDRVGETARQGALLGGGLLGAAAGGAAAGLVCGPGAPVCSTIGVVVGGALFAFGVEFAFSRNR